MATTETKVLDEIISSRRALLIGGGAALAALATPAVSKAAVAVTTYTDADILNFALNLEYLEANFYYLAAFGTTIDKPNTFSIGAGGPSTPIPISIGTTAGVAVTVKANPKVPFANTTVAGYAVETAIEEGKHVLFLQSALGTSAVSQPAIDLMTSFNTLASAAGIGAAFDPFASDAAFLVGAYIFEDVGVTAYKGAAPLITTASTRLAAVKIHAVEAYHAGLVRTTINALDPAGMAGYIGYTQQISALRSKLSLAISNSANLTTDDQPLTPGTSTVTLGTTTGLTTTNIVDADANALTFTRSTSQVLNIVTGGGATGTTQAKGVFFPNGLNGKFV